MKVIINDLQYSLCLNITIIIIIIIIYEFKVTKKPEHE